MKRSRTSHLAVLFFILFPFVSGERSRNPCHPGRSASRLGAPCEGIYLPTRLCRSCELSGYDSNGFFNDCTAIYKVSEPKCKAQLELYTKLNPCDTVRAAQLGNLGNATNRRDLDYFVYSVCEECCDCIPSGARPWAYNQRRARGISALTNLARGNCPAHAYYDICLVWPLVRHVSAPGNRLRSSFPKICPLLTSWFKSPAANNWNNNNNVTMAAPIKNFLLLFNRVARCRARPTWESCTALEKAQRRI